MNFVNIQLSRLSLFEETITDHGCIRFPGVQAKYAEVISRFVIFYSFYIFYIFNSYLKLSSFDIKMKPK